jgi:uncharacterized membrane protein (UPF0127 family)
MTGLFSSSRSFLSLISRPVLTAVFALLCLAASPESGQAVEALATAPLQIQTVTGGRHDFTVEIAATDRDRARGLMYRRALAPDRGMLFVYPRARMISMWMKNTFIPLDMIFIGASGKIVSVHERAVPHSLAPISSQKRAVAVLEVVGGLVSRLGIGPGDRVTSLPLNTAQ